MTNHPHLLVFINSFTKIMFLSLTRVEFYHPYTSPACIEPMQYQDSIRDLLLLLLDKTPPSYPNIRPNQLSIYDQ